MERCAVIVLKKVSCAGPLIYHRRQYVWDLGFRFISQGRPLLKNIMGSVGGLQSPGLLSRSSIFVQYSPNTDSGSSTSTKVWFCVLQDVEREVSARDGR